MVEDMRRQRICGAGRMARGHCLIVALRYQESSTLVQSTTYHHVAQLVLWVVSRDAKWQGCGRCATPPSLESYTASDQLNLRIGRFAQSRVDARMSSRDLEACRACRQPLGRWCRS